MLCCSWIKWSATLWKSIWKDKAQTLSGAGAPALPMGELFYVNRQMQKAPPFGGAGIECMRDDGEGHFTQMHMRAVVLISPSRLRSIWMLQVTVSALLTLLPVSTEEGRFLMVSMPVPPATSPDTVPE